MRLTFDSMSTQHAGHIPEWTQGDRLRKAREDAGLDQKELADRIGVSRATISNAEVGSRETLEVTIRAWAMATGVPLAWLQGRPVTGPDGGPGLPRLDSNQSRLA